MTFHFNVSGEERKSLVYAAGEILGSKPKYLKAPTYGFQVDEFTVGKNGELTYGDGTDKEKAEQLIEALMDKGFIPEEAESRTEELQQQVEIEKHKESDTEATVGQPNEAFTVSMPMDGFNVDSLNRLYALVAAKHTLLTKALGVDTLPIRTTDDRVEFPWFRSDIDEEHQKAYMWLIINICKMAKNTKRMSSKEKPTDNDKYTFRCFLLRLGFIGNEYKKIRKILLERLEGSSAFRKVGPAVREANNGSTLPGCVEADA